MSKRLSNIGKPSATKLEQQTGIPSAKGKLESGYQSAGNKGWGGTTKQTRTPSGVKLSFEEDNDAILQFVGYKDISDKCGKEEGEAIVMTFFDGKKLVSVPGSYALKEAVFQVGFWYYVWVPGLIANTTKGFNPMKDFEIRELGTDGETVQCPDRVSNDKELELIPELIAEINYTRLNYPLR